MSKTPENWRDLQESGRMNSDGWLIALMGGQHGDNESWINWLVFDRNEADAFIGGDVATLAAEDSAQTAHDLSGWQGHNGGAGRAFTSAPYVAKITRTQVLIRMFGGLDI